MRGVDLAIIFLLALFFFFVGIAAAWSAFFRGHFGTGIVIFMLGGGGFLAFSLAVLAYLQRDRAS